MVLKHKKGTATAFHNKIVYAMKENLPTKSVNMQLPKPYFVNLNKIWLTLLSFIRILDSIKYCWNNSVL